MRVLRRRSAAANSSKETSSGSGPSFAYALGELLAELDAAELAAVVVEQHAAVERQDGVGVLAGLAAQQQPPVMPR